MANENDTLSNQQLFNFDNFALILTATICVDNVPRAYPKDKEVREKQYLNTLEYYLNNHPKIKKIIFIENSGSCLKNLEKSTKNNPYQKQIEFISLNTNLIYSDKGKGFGECLLIETGLKQSQLINDVSYFGKITGRICLLNLTEILSTIVDDFDCLCDYKDQGYKLKKIFNKNGRPFCDTRFIAFNKIFYQKYIQSLHTDFINAFPNQYFCIEPELYQKINSLDNQVKIIKRFKVQPNFSGISGHSGNKKYGGKNYNDFSEQVKYHLRSLSRKFFPFLHF